MKIIIIIIIVNLCLIRSVYSLSSNDLVKTIERDILDSRFDLPSQNILQYVSLAKDPTDIIKNEDISRKEILDILFSGERGSGGGGDIVECAKDNFQSADFYLRDHTVKISSKLKEMNCGEALLEVHDLIEKENKLVANGLKDFIEAFIYSYKGESLEKELNRYFHFSMETLIDINDGNFQKSKINKCKLYQGALRVPLPEIIHYSFNLSSFNKIKRKPLSCSYLLLHEWSRDFIKDANEIRSFVNHLHSDAFAKRETSLFSFVKSKVIEKLTTKSKNTSSSHYFSIINKYGESGNSNGALKKKLALYSGKFLPVNQKDCSKNVLVKDKSLFIDHMMSCNNASFTKFNCNNFECSVTLPHKQCKSFEMKVELTGFFNVMNVKATCNGKYYPQTHTYYKEEIENEVVNFLKGQGKVR